MELKENYSAFLRKPSLVLGIFLIGAGLMSTVIILVHGYNLLYNPMALEKWIDLSEKVYQKGKTAISPGKETSVNNGKLLDYKNAEASKNTQLAVFDEMARVTGGYFSVFLAMLLISILTRASISIFSAGVHLIKADKSKAENSH
jgi:hypothetical protein